MQCVDILKELIAKIPFFFIFCLILDKGMVSARQYHVGRFTGFFLVVREETQTLYNYGRIRYLCSLIFLQFLQEENLLKIDNFLNLC